MTTPRIAVTPQGGEVMTQAVERGGGSVADPENADAIVWTDPARPETLGEVLRGSPARWVQLPFAGIERFVAAGVVDRQHTWTCAKGIYGHATAEHALTLTLVAARRIHRHVRSGTWLGDRGLQAPERRLKTSTVMIVGTGGIGAALRDMLLPIGARVLAVNRSGRPLDGAVRTVPIGDVHDLLGEADFVVLAAPATDATARMVDREWLEAMKDDAWLVNVARGSLVDTAALVAALRDGVVGGAALDVTDPEPLPDDHPLWTLDDVIITGHTANTWRMAVPELARLVEENVRRFAAGESLLGVVDPDLQY
ncbi:MAG TPA: D-isomer specific 2-hydroxyacid dehydrogenase family protein [Actinomycetota bacterium]|nr:D-isomer specific 2-hydroxyacid dehydrogenase family protein [Actinomycetota bacterium]